MKTAPKVITICTKQLAKNKNYSSTINLPRLWTDEKQWGTIAVELLSKQSHTKEFRERFHTHWIEAGHHIREQISDDEMLVKLLRRLLPTYDGQAIKLYRGENQERWSQGKLGFCWTPTLSVAKMFAKELNAIHTGGVLLCCETPAHAIIAAPNQHSYHLGEAEYTLDPKELSEVVCLEKYAPPNEV